MVYRPAHAGRFFLARLTDSVASGDDLLDPIIDRLLDDAWHCFGA